MSEGPTSADHHESDEARRAREVEEIRLAAAPVVAELNERGFAFSRINDLRTQGGRYTDAVPVLMKWLPLVSNPGVKQGIVRALSVPFAKASATLLIEEFRRAPMAQGTLKWVIGNALSIVADERVFASVAELVRDKQHGSSREMLALALGNMPKADGVVDVLVSLLEDEEVAGHAVMGLGTLKAKAASARPAIERFLSHPKPWIRKEAAKALKKI